MSAPSEGDVRDAATGEWSTQDMTRESSAQDSRASRESSTQASREEEQNRVREEEQNRPSVVTHDPYQQESFSGGEEAPATEESTPRPSDDHQPLPAEPRCPPGGRQIVIVQRSPPHPYIMSDPPHCSGYASSYGEMPQGAYNYDGWSRGGPDALRSLTNFDGGKQRKRRSGSSIQGGGGSSSGEAEGTTTAPTVPYPSVRRPTPSVGTRPAPCRHFLEGTCYYGDECRFSHVLSDDMERRRRLPPPVSHGEAPRTTGLCTSWYETKQYGFVRADGGPQAYVHSRRIHEDVGTRLQLGDRYSFRLVPNDRDPGRWSAIDVCLESTASSETASSTSDSTSLHQQHQHHHHHHHHHHHTPNYHHLHHTPYGHQHHYQVNQAYSEQPHHHHHHHQASYMHQHHHHHHHNMYAHNYSHYAA